MASSPRLVLIVDQLEEVFTRCTDEQERRGFIRALSAAAGTTAAAAPPPGGGASRELLSSQGALALVAIGLRADFYARSASYPELARCLQDGQVLVGPMDEAELRAAIERPAASAGLILDADLVEVLLADLGLHRRPSNVLGSAQVPGEVAALESDIGQASPYGGSYRPGCRCWPTRCSRPGSTVRVIG